MSSVTQHALAHFRLGHINERDLELIVRDGQMNDFTLDDLKEPLFCYCSSALHIATKREGDKAW